MKKARGIIWVAIFPFSIWLAMVSCDDIIEDDISNDEVFLVAPSDGVEIDSGEVTFLWKFLEGADEYELWVLSPDFDNPATVHADTLTTTNSFTASLGVGEYTWGVRAINSAYSTAFFINSFTVVAGDLDPDISMSRVNYFSPQDSVEVEEGSVVFFWERLQDARRYRLQLVSPSFDAIQSIFFDSTTVDDRVTVSLDSGEYQWRVLGINNFSQTDAAEVRTIFVD